MKVVDRLTACLGVSTVCFGLGAGFLASMIVLIEGPMSNLGISKNFKDKAEQAAIALGSSSFVCTIGFLGVGAASYKAFKLGEESFERSFFAESCKNCKFYSSDFSLVAKHGCAVHPCGKPNPCPDYEKRSTTWYACQVRGGDSEGFYLYKEGNFAFNLKLSDSWNNQIKYDLLSRAGVNNLNQLVGKKFEFAAETIPELEKVILGYSRTAMYIRSLDRADD